MNAIAFAIPREYRYVAAVLLVALLAWTMGLPAWIQKAHAAGLSSISDTLTDSSPSANSEHSVTFTTNTVLTAAASGVIRITLDPTNQFFDFSGLTNADVSTSTTHTVHDAVGSCGGGVDFYVNSIDTSNDYVEYALCTGDTLAASTVVNFSIGAEGANDINNPATTTSYVINVRTSDSGGTVDEADTRVAIVDTVTVTASVDTIFTFSINSVDAGVAVNDDPVATTGTSTATTVPFGTIAPGGANAKLMAQELRVDTNAYNGFSVTVRADQTLTAGNGATIDEFIDGAATASTTAWTSPSGTLGSTDTYGHWGVTTDDNAVSGASTTQWGIGEAVYRGDFIGNDVEIFYNNTPVEYSQGGMGVGSTTVAYKVEITNLQEAAKDYTATLTYIATPVF